MVAREALAIRDRIPALVSSEQTPSLAERLHLTEGYVMPRYEFTLTMEVVTEKGAKDAKRQALASLTKARPSDLAKHMTITVKRLSPPAPLPGQKDFFQ